jgi:hypothetical protein
VKYLNLTQIGQRSSKNPKIFYEFPIITSEPQKTAELLNWRWYRPLQDSLNFCWVGGNTLSTDQQTPSQYSFNMYFQRQFTGWGITITHFHTSHTFYLFSCTGSLHRMDITKEYSFAACCLAWVAVSLNFDTCFLACHLLQALGSSQTKTQTLVTLQYPDTTGNRASAERSNLCRKRNSRLTAQGLFAESYIESSRHRKYPRCIQSEPRGKVPGSRHRRKLTTQRIYSESH